MKKRKTSRAKAAEIFFSKHKKGRDEFSKLSPDEQAAKLAEAKAHFADLVVKAAELPMQELRKDWLEAEIERFYRDVARIASCISPEMFAGSPVDVRAAIRLALKRIQDTKRYFGEMVQQDKENEKHAQAKAEQAQLTKVRKGYVRAVKYIIDEVKDVGRAMPKWRRYVEARKVTPGSSLAKVLAQYQERWDKDGWTLLEIRQEIRIFDSWWEQEKSKQNRQFAKKRGRVKRRASDLRFKENRRHKLGYCQVCGEPTRRRKIGNRIRYERRCDKHVISTAFAFGVETTDRAPFEQRGHGGDPRKHGIIPII
jgi:dTDP-4-dehydrorhamnose 3,5-epimerase-like enzyme